MSINHRLLELALKGLEAERSKINQEIVDLSSQISRLEPGHTQPDRKPPARIVRNSTRSNGRSAVQAQQKGRLTAAGRRKLSEAAKRRWAANRKTGKTTL